jgi:hypothetical protein
VTNESLNNTVVFHCLMRRFKLNMRNEVKVKFRAAPEGGIKLDHLGFFQTIPQLPAAITGLSGVSASVGAAAAAPSALQVSMVSNFCFLLHPSSGKISYRLCP